MQGADAVWVSIIDTTEPNRPSHSSAPSELGRKQSIEYTKVVNQRNQSGYLQMWKLVALGRKG